MRLLALGLAGAAWGLPFAFVVPPPWGLARADGLPLASPELGKVARPLQQEATRLPMGPMQPPPPTLSIPKQSALVVLGAVPKGLASREDCNGEERLPWLALAPGVWAWPAAELAEVSSDNRGHVLPNSVLLGDGQAWVIDPGPSWNHGRRLRAALACRFGAQVAGVINTHAHAENVLANAGVLGRPAALGPLAHTLATVRLNEAPVWASAATRAAMALRCAACLDSLRQRAGEAAMEGTEALLPSRTLQQGASLQLGAQRLEVRLLANAHTELDTVLWAPEQGVLWVGGLVYQDRLPELAQGSLLGWLRALRDLRALRPHWVVGNALSASQGPGLPPAWLQTEAYLGALQARVLAAMDAGQDVNDPHWHELPAFAHWAGYGERQRFNAHRAWRELEPLWMAGGGAEGAESGALVEEGASALEKSGR